MDPRFAPSKVLTCLGTEPVLRLQLPWSNIAASTIQPGANVKTSAKGPKAPPSQVLSSLLLVAPGS